VARPGLRKVNRYSNEFKVTAMKMANAPDSKTKAVALHIHPFMRSRWKKEVRAGKAKGAAHHKVQELKAMEVAVAEEKRIRELNAALTTYIRFYNHHRLHSGIDYHTPEEYERLVS
jgi:transposase-like protein